MRDHIHHFIRVIIAWSVGGTASFAVSSSSIKKIRGTREGLGGSGTSLSNEAQSAGLKRREPDEDRSRDHLDSTPGTTSFREGHFASCTFVNAEQKMARIG